MERALFDELVHRVESLLVAYQEACAENGRLQAQLQRMTEQRQMVQGRVDRLLDRLEGMENP